MRRTMAAATTLRRVAMGMVNMAEFLWRVVDFPQCPNKARAGTSGGAPHIAARKSARAEARAGIASTR
jgi:hypothetical protein